MQPVYIQGLPESPGDASILPAVRELTLKATGNLSWLKQGDRVLLKPALNSSFPYPSTTHPLAVRAVADLLTERGALVTIGDQSGIEHVLHHPGGVLRGSTAGNFRLSGMKSGDDSRFIGFEDDGWENGFFHFRSDMTRSWEDGYYITRRVQTADHIINLPRISTHSMAGATLGLKNMVGLLREDSRMEFHANGPMNNFIIKAAKGSCLSSRDDGSGTFFEKIVEISDAVRSKLRLTLFCATEVQATFGPDQYSIEIGPVKLGRASVIRPDPGLLLASADPIAAEAAAFGVLKEARLKIPLIQRYLEKMALFRNPVIRSLDAATIRTHPYIRHGIAIGLGEMPEEVLTENVPEPIVQRLLEQLEIQGS